MGKRDQCYYLRQASQCRNPHSKRFGKWDCPRRFCHSCDNYKGDMWPIDIWAMRRPLPPKEQEVEMEHHPQCPLHEDYELDEQDIKRIDPAELLDLVRAADHIGPSIQSRSILHKALRPFGWMLDCKCSEIAQAEKEYQQEMRQDR